MNDNNPKNPIDDKETEAVGVDISDTTEKKPRKRKVLKIFLIILLVLALMIGFLCVRYWHIIKLVANKENIDAYFNSRKYSSEEIESKMRENKSKMEKIAEESPLIQIRGELTEEEIEAMKNGEITQEEAKSLVKGDITLEEIRENKATDESSTKPSSSKEDSSGGKTSTDEKTPSKSSADKTSSKTTSDKTSSKPSGEKKPSTSTQPTDPQDKVSGIVSELYVVQADFMNRLEAIGDQAYADYKATSYDRSQVMTIVDRYTETVGIMEAECDKKVNTLLKELDAELKKSGEDRSMVKEIRNYYYTEKSLKKSYYMDKLNSEDYK